MRKPPWTVTRNIYVAIEWVLGVVSFGYLTSPLKWVLQTDEEKRQADNPTIVKKTQEESDSLEHKDGNTLYIIVEKDDSTG